MPQCKAIEQQIAGAMGVGRGVGVGGEMHHRVVVFGAVERPLRDAAAVGIAGLGEVRPVTAHEFRYLMVFRAPRKLARREHLKYEFDFRGVRRRRFRSRGRVGSERQGLVEFVAVDRDLAGLGGHLQPFPRSEGDEAIAREILGGTFDFGLC
jgi:hypothetical protein